MQAALIGKDALRCRQETKEKRRERERERERERTELIAIHSSKQ